MLPVDVIFGASDSYRVPIATIFSAVWLKIEVVVYGIAIMNRKAYANANLTFPSFQPGDKVPVHHLYAEADGPKGPLSVRSCLSPVDSCF